MSGHVALVMQDILAQTHSIRRLGEEGYRVSCFSAVEEATRFFLEPGCPACVMILNVNMRRQGDALLVQQLKVARPAVKIFLVNQQEGNWPETLHGDKQGICLLRDSLNHPDTLAALKKYFRAVGSTPVGVAETGVARGNALSTYSEDFLRRVGEAEVPVLLCGETGVGKEVMARRLRSLSRRADKPFLKLNCAALPADLAESELFGSVKGAFTGAVADRQGRFELAQGGTILLDEIGDMDLRLQTKLLQVLQDGEIQPLGSSRTVRVDVRVMAATHRDLTKCIQDGTFREDLYYRLNVVKIEIPPLRERRDEILPLAEKFLVQHQAAGQARPLIDERLKGVLMEYRWPGNVRELENVMRRFLVYQDASLLLQELLGNHPRPASSLLRPGAGVGPVVPHANFRNDLLPGPIRRADRLDQLAESARVAEMDLLLRALEANRWNRRKAAASLQIEYKAFLYKLQKYRIVESGARGQQISA